MFEELEDDEEEGFWVMVLPLSTASTAAWHCSHFPDQSNPTDPDIGSTIRPHASYNSDLNIAAKKQTIIIRTSIVINS